MKRINRHTKPSAGKASGGLLGMAVLLAGTTWCLKNHTRLSLPHHQRSSGLLGHHKLTGGHNLKGGHHLGSQRGLASGHHKSGGASWLLAAAGAGLAGLAFAGVKSRQSRHPGTSRRAGSDINLTGNITIHRSPEEVYQFWKDFRNLPKVMSFIERVEPMEGNVSHWVARIPGGGTVEWDSETVDDQPGKLLAWRSLEGSDLQTWGTVFFQPAHAQQSAATGNAADQKDGTKGSGESTEVSVSFNFSPPDRPSQIIGEYMSTLENAVLNHNLRQLKSTLEAETPKH